MFVNFGYINFQSKKFAQGQTQLRDFKKGSF